jgi:hypothetical protein
VTANQTDRERQGVILSAIRSLLEDGLMQIGELPGRDGTFPAWEPIDVVVDGLRERFVTHVPDCCAGIPATGDIVTLGDE